MGVILADDPFVFVLGPRDALRIVNTDACSGSSAFFFLLSLPHRWTTPQPLLRWLNPTPTAQHSCVHSTHEKPMSPVKSLCESTAGHPWPFLPSAGPLSLAPFSISLQHQPGALGSPVFLKFSDKRCYQSLTWRRGEGMCEYFRYL